MTKMYYDQTPPSEDETFDPFAAIYAHSRSVSSSDEIIVAVVGVGYVGHHLVETFSSKYRVVGFDVSLARVKQLSTDFSHLKNVTFTTNSNNMADATHFLIAVPTLLRPDHSIDCSYLLRALQTVSSQGRRGATVVIESSVAVGMTRHLLGPIAAARGFFAGMSPERVDPGRTEPPAHSIPKIVSGLDDAVPGSLDKIAALYSSAFDTVVRVSRPEVAEMMKLYENCQRMIGIAYANEMADACVSHGIDPFEVCKAAATKPFGYLPFTPSVGVGGHCIPVNPYYLFSNNEFPLLREATEKMRNRPAQLAMRLAYDLVGRLDLSRKPRVLVVGIGFKAGQSHLSNSPGVELVKGLVLSGQVDVSWIDPLVKGESFPQVFRVDRQCWNKEYLEASFEEIVVCVKQHGLDFGLLSKLDKVHITNWCA